jgi:hypothetical protein
MKNPLAWATLMLGILCATMLKGCDMCEQTNRLGIQYGGKMVPPPIGMEGRSNLVMPSDAKGGK